jgi:hypothetical protein
MSESSQEQVEQEREDRGFFSRHFDQVEDRWEAWAKIGVGLLIIQLVMWVVVYLRLGVPSVYAHAIGIPLLANVTIPIAFWGLLRTFFRPPTLRRSRTIGFFALVAVGLMGNVPVFSVPLSTEDWESRHTYRLPFDGEWMTLAGGDSRQTNYHATTATFRWGYDFTLTESSRMHTGDGTKLEDYHCFGQPVLAAAGGLVVEAIDYLEDVTPGQTDIATPLGNHVVIRVDQDEYLYTAHLRKSSLTVKDGDTVVAGQKIGECGNSGLSLAPHVHVHLQNSKNFPFAESLPLRFSNFEADKKPVDRGMPVGTPDRDKVAGQYVRHRP